MLMANVRLAPAESVRARVQTANQPPIFLRNYGRSAENIAHSGTGLTGKPIRSTPRVPSVRHSEPKAGWRPALIGLVLVECAVLAVNWGRCPLSDLAVRYAEKRTNNFNIYLPLWLARHNKTILERFSSLGHRFVLGRPFPSGLPSLLIRIPGTN